MRAPSRCLAIVAVAIAASGSAIAKDCRQASMDELRAASPGGYAIYEQVKAPEFFTSWIDCSDAQYNLSTAVHESTHYISAEIDAFPLVGGGTVARPHEVSAFFPPYRMAGRFKGDDFAAIYLRRGKASSSTDFLYLLDEFNAYTHDLAAAVDLKELRSPSESVDHRDGLAAMMAFLAAYAETARRGEPETWDGLREPRAATTVRMLWSRAERVMAASCGIPNFGTNDRAYLKQVCANGADSALGEILGRAPACPSACLEETPDRAHASDAAVAAPSRFTTQGASGKRHPFDVQVGPARHRLQARERAVEERIVHERTVEDRVVEERSGDER